MHKEPIRIFGNTKYTTSEGNGDDIGYWSTVNTANFNAEYISRKFVIDLLKQCVFDMSGYSLTDKRANRNLDEAIKIACNETD